MTHDEEVRDLMNRTGATREETEAAFAQADEIMAQASDPKNAADWVYPDDMLAGAWLDGFQAMGHDSKDGHTIVSDDREVHGDDDEDGDEL